MYIWNPNVSKKVYYVGMVIKYYNEDGDAEYDDEGYCIRARDEDEAIETAAEVLAAIDGFEVDEITEIKECKDVGESLIFDADEILYNKIFCIEYKNDGIDEVYIKSNSEEEAEFEFKAILKRLHIDIEILNVYEVDNYDKNKLINDKTDSELKTMFESKTEFNTIWNTNLIQ